MPKIYERNPDTGEIREREFLMYDQDGMFTTEALQGDTKMAIKDQLPEEEPYRNYTRESLEILNRMEKKLDALLEEQENKRDDGR